MKHTIPNRYSTPKPGRTENNRPTLTDQSAARDTDINVIIRKMEIAGTPLQTPPAAYADISDLPQDFRDMIHATREIAQIRKALPKQLRDKPPEEILAMTPEQLRDILKPPAPTPAAPPAPTPASPNEPKKD